MIIDNQGTIVLFCPENDLESEWLITNVQAEEYQWMGRTLSVDHRMADDLFQVVAEAGLMIEQR